MKITVFTSNQPRHLSLVRSLATAADVVFAVHECNTLFPGQVEDFFHKTPVMQTYFQHVIDAERSVFGDVAFSPSNVRYLSMKSGDLNRVSRDVLQEALAADIFVVFGASYIKGWLIDELVSRGAINIHIGVSPYYRGNSCNFWALYDMRPNLVGSTIHLLSSGLDSGPILFHALPKPGAVEPFELGMRAVRAAHLGLLQAIKSGALATYKPVLQDRGQELRYTRNRDFNDAVAEEYLARKLDAERVGELFQQATNFDLINPVYY
jgi:folate-dependent phosphoribosylglycinamide formyltransferase PurN